MKNIFFFQWISDLGGADTRLKEVIQCFASSKKYNLFIIPNDDFRLQEKHNTDFLDKNGVKILTWNTLPEETEGYAIAFCNFRLFEEPWRLEKIKQIGLKFIWSNDMMWTKNEEASAINKFLVDAVIFTSRFHQDHLILQNPAFQNTVNYILPNYFHYENYKNKRIPKKEHLKDKYIIGKISRADWAKYSENFPNYYSRINIPNKHFRFMGWNEELTKKYSWFNFDDKFEFLKPNEEGIIEFLSQLDLYVYNCHHKFTENQSRAIIEAQLLGIPCIVPKEGNFPNMVWHERTGFIFDTIEQSYDYINELYNNKDLYNSMCENSKVCAKSIWCDTESQLKYWETLFKLI
jgi:glycosyltransferase involved in cell wall biosynthesis